MNVMMKSTAAAVVTATPAIASAAPATTDRRALESYASWLFMERRLLCLELYPDMGVEAERYDFAQNAGYGWHFNGEQDWRAVPQPSSRAARVLELVGVDWRAVAHPEWEYTDSGRRPSIAGFWAVDAELICAVCEMQTLDLALNGLHDQFGEGADDRDDYNQIEARRGAARRDEIIELLATVKARSHEGIVAKAEALTLKPLVEDNERHHEIASSLADDVLHYFEARTKEQAA